MTSATRSNQVVANFDRWGIDTIGGTGERFATPMGPRSKGRRSTDRGRWSLACRPPSRAARRNASYRIAPRTGTVINSPDPANRGTPGDGGPARPAGSRDRVLALSGRRSRSGQYRESCDRKIYLGNGIITIASGLVRAAMDRIFLRNASSPHGLFADGSDTLDVPTANHTAFGS